MLVREFGNGRVVNFSHAANFRSLGLALQDLNIQRLYVNAVSWISEVQVTSKFYPPTSTMSPFFYMDEPMGLKNEKPTRLYIIRNGEVEKSRQGKFNGHSNVKLSQEGI